MVAKYAMLKAFHSRFAPILSVDDSNDDLRMLSVHDMFVSHLSTIELCFVSFCALYEIRCLCAFLNCG